MSSMLDVVGICRTCKGGIILPVHTIEHEKGQTRRIYCKPECRKNRSHPRFWQAERTKRAVQRGLDSAARGELHDLGSFSQFADDEISDS